MLIGHYGPALLLRAHWRAVPLWLLFVATQWVDIVFFVLATFGLESATVHPGEHPRFVVTAGQYTHSLVAAGLWMVAAGGVFWGRPAARWPLALAVGSHWFLDAVVHVPDLPLAWFSEVRIGLGLWRSPLLAWLAEVGMVVGCYAWLRPCLQRARRGDALVIALVLVQTLSQVVVPTPPTALAIGLSAQAIYLGFAAAAWWVR